MSFFSKVGAVVKDATNKAVEATKATYNHAKSLPTEIHCKGCPKKVMVPKSTFNWKCGSCSTVNEYENKHCSKCAAAKPDKMPPYTITCTMCNHLNEVPTTNFVAGVNHAATKTKEAAISAKEAAERQYAFMKSQPLVFNCEHCNVELNSPNPPPQDPEGQAEGQSEQDAKQAEAAFIPKVVCPVCKKVTDVPKSNFRNHMTKAKSNLVDSSSRLYYKVAGKKYFHCPVCRNTVKAPETESKDGQKPQLPPKPQPSAPPGYADVPSAAEPSAPALNGQLAAPEQSAQPTKPLLRVDLTCEKCQTVFPAMV